MARGEAAVAGELLEHVDKIQEHLRKARLEAEQVRAKLDLPIVSEDTKTRAGVMYTNLTRFLGTSAKSARNLTALFTEKRGL